MVNTDSETPSCKVMKVEKRTFEARKHPPGSPERAELNRSGVTSEYMTSYKYQLVGPNFSAGYKTRGEAEAAKARMEAA